MRAQIIRRFGGAEVLEPAELPVPVPAAGQVLVRVAATSVNTADVKGRHLGHALDFVPDLPFVGGIDLAGTVEAVGPGVVAFSPGDEVFGSAGGVRGHGGALAEFIAADARLLARKPRNLSMVEAAALPLAGITAWEGLFDRMAVQPGESVLVHGGAGGVGHLAIQLAVAAGARVVATDTGADRLAAVGRLGAEPVDYRAEAPAEYVARLAQGRGFDAVFDTVGGGNIPTALAGARHDGRMATTVSLTNVDLTEAHLRGLSLHVIYMLIPMLHGHGRERHGHILARLAALAEQGRLKPVVGAVFPLERAADAHRALEEGRVIGKVVVAAIPEATAAPAGHERDAAATVRAWYATRDPGLLAEDIVWRVLPDWPAGGDWHGREAVIERFFPTLLARFDAYAAEAEEVLQLGPDRAVSFGWYRGRGPGGDFTARFTHLWTVRDGRITRFEQVADTAAIARAQGARS